MNRLWTAIGAINALLAVAAGAFGAHALRGKIPAERLAVFETGARYHMYHALGLLFIAWAVGQARPLAPIAGVSMTLGIILFSGSLYALSITGIRALGAITPLGGLGFMIGWALLAYSALK